MATLNTRSLYNKSTTVADLISERDYDVCVLTETWHSTSDDLSLRRAAPVSYLISDSARAMYDHATHPSINHGGIAIIYRSNLTVRRILLDIVPKTFELHICSIKQHSSAFIVAAIYRPGSVAASAMFFEEFSSLLESLTTLRSSLVLIGDFNIHVDDLADARARHFLDILETFDLQQHVHEPTHMLGHTLDLVITRPETSPVNVLVDPPVYSDHGIVACSLPYQPAALNVYCTKQIRDLRKLNLPAFQLELRHSAICKQTPALSSLPTDELFDMYHNLLSSIVNQFAPFKSINVKQRPHSPWFDADCRASRRKARSLERRFRLTHSHADRLAWTNHLQLKRSLIRNKQAAYWTSIIDEAAGNSSRLWRRLNALLARDPVYGPKESCITAETLSDYFSAKVESIRAVTATSPPPVFRILTEATFNEFTLCSENDIRSFILQAPAKSCSMDPLPYQVLRDNLDNLLPFITTMCNNSLKNGHLPLSQKSAIITPVIKKAGLDPSIAANYRPISNLTFVSKLIERIVARQTVTYLTVNNLFPTEQSAYRSFHSTETAMLRITSDIHDAADKSMVTLLAMLDLSAAFDTVDHSILLNRLETSYGLRDNVLAWIASFLHGRKQSVMLDDHLSVPCDLLCGVPQGSVLGPMLFLLYIADVITIAESYGVRVHCYADDIQLYVHCLVKDVDDATRRLIACIAAINDWMLSNRLKLNPGKTQLIWIGTWQQLKKFPSTNLVMQDGSIITPTKTVCSLGVVLDEQIKMDAHASSVVRSCSFQLRQIRSIRSSLTINAASTLVHAFVSCRLDYCNSVMYGTSGGTTQKIQSIINSAARLISGTHHFDHITPILRDQLHWLPFRFRVVYKIALIVYRCLHQSGPAYLTEMLIPVNTIANRLQLRSAQHGDLLCPAYRTTRVGPASFRSSGPYVWNSLPPRLRDPAISLECFKSNLKTHLFKLAYNI